jgi:hypothetical protein
VVQGGEVKFGIDMDGVLCDFIQGYNALAKAQFGIELPYPAVTWDHGPTNGITKSQDNTLWELIKSTPFHGALHALPGALDAIGRLNVLGMQGHSVYFITSRPGPLAKFWAEVWLKNHGMDLPTVLIASKKGYVAKGLQLDVFVDDKPENNLDVLGAVGCQGLVDPPVRVYLIDQPWNQWADQPLNYGKRVKDLNEVLDIELTQTERKAA